jgi:ATP-dependent protease ClpP protease subunit
MTPKMHDVFIQFVLSQKDVTEYIVYLTSLGGTPFVGFNLYSFMKSRPEHTTVYNMANVDSAALQFFLGFKKRLSTPFGTFMIHPTTSTRDVLPQQYSQFDVQKALQQLEATEAKTAQIIVTETSARAQTPLTTDHVRQSMLASRVIGAAEARTLGIIDGIAEPMFPPSDVFYLTETYLAHIPPVAAASAP